MQRRLMGIRELSEYIGVRPQTIYNKISNGNLPIPFKKVFGRIKFERAAVDRFLEKLPYRNSRYG